MKQCSIVSYWLLKGEMPFTFKQTDMTFEEASDMYAMYSISPELTCQCDKFHMCQQCHEDAKNESNLNALENQTYEGD